VVNASLNTRGGARREVELALTDPAGLKVKVKGSIGNSQWAAVPWIAVFDRIVTESAMRGYAKS